MVLFPGRQEDPFYILGDAFSFCPTTLSSGRGDLVGQFNGVFNGGGGGSDVEVTVPLDGFVEDDVKVSVDPNNGNVLKITAEKVEKDESGEVVSTRKMSRVGALPRDANVAALRKKIGNDGNAITITVPRKQREYSTAVVVADVDTSGYEPDELSVELSKDGRKVTVRGRHVEIPEDGLSVSATQFTRSFPVPEGADADEVVTSLDREAKRLKVVAAAAKKEEKLRNIHIHMEEE